MIACPRCEAEYDDDDLRFCGRCGSDMRREEPGASEDLDPLVGQTIDGRYKVMERLGQGGMGAVYQVEHLAMGKRAAMKVLHPTLTNDPEVGARFQREAEAVSKLSHPNTVQVFDFGRSRGLSYLVMELVRGEDLGSLLRRDGPMSWERTSGIVLSVCEALSEAHELGIVHRDLKPENLLLSRTRDGRDQVKVVDFGLAKLRDREEANQVTARGSLVGTPFYMSPEQIRAEEADGRSDIYSLGALMYRMVTGQPPFSAPTPVAVLTQHLTENIVPPTVRRPDLKLPPEVDRVIARAMAKEREARYQTIEELADALRATGHAVPVPQPRADGHRKSDRPDPDTTEAQRLSREDIDGWERSLKRRRWIGATVAPLLILGTLSGVFWWRWHSRPQPVEVEVEPNNTPKEANLIGQDQTVRGHIGKCLTPQESDRDFFRFHVDEAPASLNVSLTGIPAMNLKLEVFDPHGQRLADADDGDPGEGEHLPNVRLPVVGEYYVAVREMWIEGRPATEDEINWYTLKARWHAASTADGANLEETEPDDTPSQALALAPGVPMRGYAGRAHDVDYYYLRGDGGGTVSGTLSAIDGVDLRVVALPAGSTLTLPLPPGPLPAGVRVFDSGGPGMAEEFDGIPWAAGSPGPILVVERKEKDAEPDTKPDSKGKPETPAKRHSHRQLVGLDTPYTLTARLRP